MSVRFVIDPIVFVNNESVHRDRIALRELIRLRDVLFSDEGMLDYQIKGCVGLNGGSALKLSIKGDVNLICQRCLNSLVHEIAIENYLYLAGNNVEFDRLSENNSIDAIMVVPQLDVIDLIEEEIILGLPVSPGHEDHQCNPDQPRLNKTSFDEASRSTNPFKVLVGLKKTN